VRRATFRRPGAGPGSCRAPKAEQTGWGHGPALHDQRRDHQDEDAGKQPLVAMRIGQAGNDAEVDRNRPAQPHPGGEGWSPSVSFVRTAVGRSIGEQTARAGNLLGGAGPSRGSWSRVDPGSRCRRTSRRHNSLRPSLGEVRSDRFPSRPGLGGCRRVEPAPGARPRELPACGRPPIAQGSPSCHSLTVRRHLYRR
jgi:hypothetical protein